MMPMVRHFPQIAERSRTLQIISSAHDFWANPEIQIVAALGILDAPANPEFRPSRIVTHGEFAMAVSA